MAKLNPKVTDAVKLKKSGRISSREAVLGVDGVVDLADLADPSQDERDCRLPKVLLSWIQRHQTAMVRP